MRTPTFLHRAAGLASLALLFALAAPAAAEDLTIGADGGVSIELVGSEAGFSNTLSVESPGVAIGSAGCRLEPAGGLPGVPVVSEKRARRGCRVSLDSDPFTDGVQPFAAGTTFRFGFCAQVDSDAACDFVWSSDSGNNPDGIEHVHTTDLAPGGETGRVFRLEWEDLAGGGDNDFNDLIVIVRVEADSDGDGLWDDWEKFGVDTTGDGIVDLNLPALGANPLHKDIFVEVDWMDCTVAGSDCAPGDTHNHRPLPEAIAAVVQAFADANVTYPDGSKGISLHVDIGNAIPHTQFLAIPGACFAGGAVNFDTIKNNPANFGPDNPRRLAYHYALFTHLQDPSSSATGCSEVPGNDFQISLGGFPGGGTVMQQAGTFMHELGHNLNLRHGGNVDTNLKPNYVSVMNYFYQLSGIPPTDPDGGGPLTARLDFSKEVLAPLDETNLSEPLGVGAGADTIFYRCSDGSTLSAAGSSPVDWNCDGDNTDLGVSSDINGDTTTSTLDGFFDWQNVVLAFQATGDFEEGVHTPVADPEIDFETYQETVAPELALTQTASAVALNGSNVTYTIRVTNNRPGQATGVAVQDVLPAGTSFVSCTATHNGTCSGNGRNRTITFPVLPGGGTATVTLVANLDCSLANGTVLRNAASVDFSLLDPDPSNNTASAEVRVVNLSPVLPGVTADHTVLSPPNHKLVDVTVAYSVTDNCGVLTCALDVASNEPVNGLGDGDTAPDWQILDEHHLRLRAERSGTGSGRLYTLGVTCTDSAGNAARQTLGVTVPKNHK